MSYHVSLNSNFDRYKAATYVFQFFTCLLLPLHNTNVQQPYLPGWSDGVKWSP